MHTGFANDLPARDQPTHLTSWPILLRRAAPLAAVALWVLVVLGPALALAGEVIASLAAQAPADRLAWLARAWPGAARGPLLGRSVLLAGSAALGATVAGFFAATVLWTTRWRRARWLLLALAPIPPYVHALAWATAWARWSEWTGGTWAPGTNALAHGAPAAGWVLAMSLLPLTTGLALVALESLPAELIDAARIARGDAWALRAIVLPLCAPWLAAATGIGFALLLLDYSVPALFQVEVYALALFADYSAHGDAARAAWSALSLVLIAGGGVLISFAWLRRSASRTTWRPDARRTSGSRASALRWPPAWRAARFLGAASLALHLAIPVVFLAVAVGTLERMAGTISSAGGEIRYSLLIAGGTVVLGLPLALAAARRLARGARWEWLLVLVPLALPAPLVAVGWITLWNRPGISGAVYDAGAGPVLVALARFLPFAALALLAWRRRRDPLLSEAARVLVPSWTRRVLAVDLPIAAPGLAAAGALLFALTLGELGATLLVVPPGHETVAMRVFSYLHYGAGHAVAGLCLALAVLVAATAALGLVAVLPPAHGHPRG